MSSEGQLLCFPGPFSRAALRCPDYGRGSGAHLLAGPGTHQSQPSPSLAVGTGHALTLPVPSAGLTPAAADNCGASWPVHAPGSGSCEPNLAAVPVRAAFCPGWGRPSSCHQGSAAATSQDTPCLSRRACPGAWTAPPCTGPLICPPFTPFPRRGGQAGKGTQGSVGLCKHRGLPACEFRTRTRARPWLCMQPGGLGLGSAQPCMGREHPGTLTQAGSGLGAAPRAAVRTQG